MTTTNKKMTEVQALTAVVDVLTNTPAEEYEQFACAAEAPYAELVEKISHMLATRTKKREKDPNAPKRKTKERIENEKLAVEASEAIKEHGEAVGSKWVMEHVRYVTSTQKATSVMKVAGELGLVTKDYDKKGNVFYDIVR